MSNPLKQNDATAVAVDILQDNETYESLKGRIIGRPKSLKTLDDLRVEASKGPTLSKESFEKLIRIFTNNIPISQSNSSNHSSSNLEDATYLDRTFLDIFNEKSKNHKKILEEKQADGNLGTRKETPAELNSSDTVVDKQSIVSTEVGSVFPVSNSAKDNKAKAPIKSKTDIDKENFKLLLQRLTANINIMFNKDGKIILNDDELRANFRKWDSDLGSEKFNLNISLTHIHYADAKDLQTLTDISNKLQNLLTSKGDAFESDAKGYATVPLSLVNSKRLLEYLKSNFGSLIELCSLVNPAHLKSYELEKYFKDNSYAISQALSAIINNRNTAADLVEVLNNHFANAAIDSIQPIFIKNLFNNQRFKINDEHAGTYWTGLLLKNKAILNQCSAKTLLNLTADKPNLALDLAKGISDSKTAHASNFIRRWWFRLTNKFPIEFAAKFDTTTLLQLIDKQPETLSVFLKNKEMRQFFIENVFKTSGWITILEKYHHQLIPLLWQEAKIKPKFLADNLDTNNLSNNFIDAFRFIFGSNDTLQKTSVEDFLTILSGNRFAYAALGIPFSINNLEAGQAASIKAFLQQQAGGINNAKIRVFVNAMLNLDSESQNGILKNDRHQAVIKVFANYDKRLSPLVRHVVAVPSTTLHPEIQTGLQPSGVTAEEIGLKK